MTTLIAFGFGGGSEWFIIFCIVLLFFGAKKIPQLAKSLGKATREFKDAKNSFHEALNEEAEETEVKDTISKQPNIAPPLEEEEQETSTTNK